MEVPTLWFKKRYCTTKEKEVKLRNKEKLSNCRKRVKLGIIMADRMLRCGIIEEDSWYTRYLTCQQMLI